MEKIKRQFKHFFTDRYFVTSLLLATCMLVVSLIINFYANNYAVEKASNSVTDLILDNTKIYDVDAAFIYGPIIFWVFITIISLAKPQRIPFILKSISLFVIIRAIFVSLTHIAPFPARLMVPEHVLKDFTLGSDLFFSGHTGLPFLMALIFWEDTYLRYIFISSSIFFGIIVLLGHLHYSIDVLSAFFITYTIHHIASFLFKKDKAVSTLVID